MSEAEPNLFTQLTLAREGLHNISEFGHYSQVAPPGIDSFYPPVHSAYAGRLDIVHRKPWQYGEDRP
jgi:hypothetical protein